MPPVIPQARELSTRASLTTLIDGAGAARCVTPAATRAGTVGVRVVRGDAVLVVASVAFEYHGGMSVRSVEPAAGGLSGGTLVRVRRRRARALGGGAPRR